MAEHKCPSCSNFVNTNERYCLNCGENNAKFSENTTFSSTSNPSSNSTTTNTSQGSGFGWFILGLFLPLVGYILFFSLKKENPTASSMSLTGAIIGTLIGLFFI
jgi:hypothetical protein